MKLRIQIGSSASNHRWDTGTSARKLKIAKTQPAFNGILTDWVTSVHLRDAIMDGTGRCRTISKTQGWSISETLVARETITFPRRDGCRQDRTRARLHEVSAPCPSP